MTDQTTDAPEYCTKQCSREDKSIGACMCDHMTWMRIADPVGHAITNPEPKAEFYGDKPPARRRDYIAEPLANPYPPSVHKVNG